MGATQVDTSNAVAQADAPLTRAEAVRLAQAYVAAYNNRDLDGMLALQDKDIVSHPARLFDHQPSRGHAGVRAWWARMVAAGRRYHVVVRDIRQLGTDQVAVLGEIRDEGQLLSPWAVVIRIRRGLIIESRSYLSDEDLLERLSVLR